MPGPASSTAAAPAAPSCSTRSSTRAARRRSAPRCRPGCAPALRSAGAIALHRDRRVGARVRARAARRRERHGVGQRLAHQLAQVERLAAGRRARRARCAPARATARRAARRARCRPPGLAWPRRASRRRARAAAARNCSRSAVSGERSSCAASATKARWVPSACCSRCQQRVERARPAAPPRRAARRRQRRQRLVVARRTSSATRRSGCSASADQPPHGTSITGAASSIGSTPRQRGRGGQRAAHLARLRDLDHAVARGHAEGAPGLAADGDVGEAEHRARRQCAVRPRGVDHAPVDGPDLDHEFEAVRRPSRRTWAGAISPWSRSDSAICRNW